MEPGLTLHLPIGTDRDFPLRANGPDGKAATGLLSGDALSAMVWLGADQAPLFSPSVVWVSAPSATYTLSFAAAQTASLGVGMYRVRVLLARSGRSAPILESWLNLVGSAGVAVPLPIYGTAAGVRDHLPFGDRYEPSSGLAGFARELGRARQWLDGIILKKCPRGAAGGIDSHTAALYTWQGNVLGRPRVLKQYLDANKLVQTPEVCGVVERYAAYLVLNGIIKNKSDDGLKARSAELLIEAHACAAALVVEIDTNADGYGEWCIPIGITNTRYA